MNFCGLIAANNGYPFNSSVPFPSSRSSRTHCLQQLPIAIAMAEKKYAFDSVFLGNENEPNFHDLFIHPSDQHQLKLKENGNVQLFLRWKFSYLFSAPMIPGGLFFSQRPSQVLRRVNHHPREPRDLFRSDNFNHSPSNNSLKLLFSFRSLRLSSLRAYCYNKQQMMMRIVILGEVSIM